MSVRRVRARELGDSLMLASRTSNRPRLSCAANEAGRRRDPSAGLSSAPASLMPEPAARGLDWEVRRAGPVKRSLGRQGSLPFG